MPPHRPRIRIALIGGDGIGPEVVAEARRAVDAAASCGLASISWEEFPLGADHFLATGETLPDATFARLSGEFDAILFGAVGDARVPDGRHARDLLLGLRRRLDLFVNFRPLVLRAPDLTPLRDIGDDPIDFVIFRENTEGLYGGRGWVERPGEPEERAVSECVATRPGVERIVRAAFEHAALAGRDLVTLADKANAVPHAFGLWRRVFEQIAAEFPGITPEMRFVDALTMELVRDPASFQVIVTENLLGDILSDLGAQLIGGPGLAPSANLHPGGAGLYEPVHGSAPDLAGSGRANPMAAILTAALLLRDRGASAAAATLETAVDDALVAGVRTPDLGGELGTTDVGGWIADRVAALATG